MREGENIPDNDKIISRTFVGLGSMHACYVMESVKYIAILKDLSIEKTKRRPAKFSFNGTVSASQIYNITWSVYFSFGVAITTVTLSWFHAITYGPSAAPFTNMGNFNFSMDK